jgi:hypothetical protein
MREVWRARGLAQLLFSVAESRVGFPEKGRPGPLNYPEGGIMAQWVPLRRALQPTELQMGVQSWESGDPYRAGVWGPHLAVPMGHRGSDLENPMEAEGPDRTVPMRPEGLG